MRSGAERCAPKCTKALTPKNPTPRGGRACVSSRAYLGSGAPFPQIKLFHSGYFLCVLLYVCRELWNEE